MPPVPRPSCSLLTASPDSLSSPLTNAQMLKVDAGGKKLRRRGAPAPCVIRAVGGRRRPALKRRGDKECPIVGAQARALSGSTVETVAPVSRRLWVDAASLDAIVAAWTASSEAPAAEANTIVRAPWVPRGKFF